MVFTCIYITVIVLYAIVFITVIVLYAIETSLKLWYSRIQNV